MFIETWSVRAPHPSGVQCAGSTLVWGASETHSTPLGCATLNDSLPINMQLLTELHPTDFSLSVAGVDT